MSEQQMNHLTVEKKTRLKSPDRGMPFKKMAKILTKRLHKAKEHEVHQDLVDQPWFHGRLTSEYAVKRLGDQGKFLVREDPASPGHYFMSINDNGSVKNFPVQRTTTKNMKYKYRLGKSESFESLVDLIEHLYVSKFLITDSGKIRLSAAVNRDTGLLVAPEQDARIQVTSAPPTRAGTPPLLKRNNSDPNLTTLQVNDMTPRTRLQSRSSPPSLYVDEFNLNESESLYDEINLPPKQSTLLKKKQTILSDVLGKFRNTLYKVFVKNDCLTLAKYLTQRDLEIVWGEDLDKENKENGLSSINGLELILFPDGSELRQAILKRQRVISTWVSCMVIAGGETDGRVGILKIFIGIAHALFSSLGNLNSFMAVMDGLEATQVNRLKKTWGLLENTHPNLSIVYHNTLRSVYAVLNSQGTHSFPGKIKPCLPYIAHVVKCLEVGPNPLVEAVNDVNELDELQVMLNHLSSARDIAAAAVSYRGQAVEFIKNMKGGNRELESYVRDTVDVSRAVGLGFRESEVALKMEGLLTLMSEHVES